MNTAMRAALCAAAGSLITATLPAQNQSVLFIMDADEITLDNGNGLLEAGLLREDEVGIVTPVPGGDYSARTFFGAATQWAWRGDDDMDGRFADSSTDAPGSATDAIMVKRFLTPVGGFLDPRQVCISKEVNYSVNFGFLDGDVYYHPTQGSVKLFVSEAQIDTACGITDGSDLRAICQDSNGDLYLSFGESETVNGTALSDGSIVHIPSSSITYDMSGDVINILPGSAVGIIDEPDLIAFTNASGVADFNGGTSTSLFDVSALEIDPNGGTWVSPLDGQTYPNLLYGWQGSGNEGAILSTSGGGSIAVINGVPMGSTVSTTGTQIGLLPDTTGLGGIHGLALVDEQPGFLSLENWPINLVTTVSTLFTRQEVSNATPGGPVAFLVSFGPGGIGGALSSLTLGGGIVGDFFEPASAIVVNTTTADPDGYASNAFNFPEVLRGSGVNLCWQAFDLSRLQFSTPAAIQFL
ncbi:MAG: hypothetical protein AAF196_02780 [Planctomycetota bacterium]